MFASDVFRDVPGGVGVAGISVEIMQPNGTVITTVTTTDGNATGAAATFPGKPRGYWEYKDRGDFYAGLRWRATYLGQIREGSSIPTGPTRYTQMGEMHRYLRAAGNGIIPGDANQLAVTLPGARVMRVNTGSAVVGGMIFTNYASYDYPAGLANASGVTRYDLLVVRVHPEGSIAPGGEGKTFFHVYEGSGGVVTPPQNDGDGIDLPLAYATLPNGASNYTAITPYLIYAFPGRNTPISRGIHRDDNAAQLTLTTGGTVLFADTTEPLAQGVTYHVTIRVTAMLYAETSLVTRSILQAFATVGGVTTLGAEIGQNLTGWMEITNYYKTTVVGAGAGIAYGTTVKMQGTGLSACRMSTATCEAYPTR